MPANNKVSYFEAHHKIIDTAIRKKQNQEDRCDKPCFVHIFFKDQPKYHHGNNRKTQYNGKRYQNFRKGYHRELGDIKGIKK